jgi:endonuclease/exonuclease/phosphatase family metal-dependent hydrolase
MRTRPPVSIHLYRGPAGPEGCHNPGITGIKSRLGGGWKGGRLAGLLLTAVAGATPGRTEALVVATYNVENYGPVDRVTGEGFRRDYPKPEAEKGALRAVIRGLGADILALQEMGGVSYLEELRRDLAAEGLSYPQEALVEAEDSRRRIALLSRLPLKSIVRHADLSFPYAGGTARVKRGLLEAVVGTSAGDLTLFVVHLKSRLTERPDDPGARARRLAEATAVRERIRRRFPDPARARFVILGDCNDAAGDPAVQRLEARGGTVMALALPADDSRGEVWTEFYRREATYTQLDHILVSPLLRPAVRGGRARIYDGPGVAVASDHRPVWATLDLSREGRAARPSPSGAINARSP